MQFIAIIAYNPVTNIDNLIIVMSLPITITITEHPDTGYLDNFISVIASHCLTQDILVRVIKAQAMYDSTQEIEYEYISLEGYLKHSIIYDK